MKTYRIKLTPKGESGRIEDTISATSRFDAERVIKSRYPGCMIWDIRED